MFATKALKCKIIAYKQYFYVVLIDEVVCQSITLTDNNVGKIGRNLILDW